MNSQPHTKSVKPAAPAAKRRIFIVDDHPIVRHGLRTLIDQEPDLTVCGEAGDPTEALAGLERLRPDAIVLDLELGRFHGLDLIGEFEGRQIKAPTLVLSMHEESLYAERAYRAGARGYVMKHQTVPCIAQALRQIMRGELFFSEAVVKRILEHNRPHADGVASSDIDRLSARELEILRLMGQGFVPREIARALSLSVKTIDTHREQLKHKLGMATTAELSRFAIAWLHHHLPPPPQHTIMHTPKAR